jgi:hypothetical protein
VPRVQLAHADEHQVAVIEAREAHPAEGNPRAAACVARAHNLIRRRRHAQAGGEDMNVPAGPFLRIGH